MGDEKSKITLLNGAALLCTGFDRHGGSLSILSRFNIYFCFFYVFFSFLFSFFIFLSSMVFFWFPLVSSGVVIWFPFDHFDHLFPLLLIAACKGYCFDMI